MSLFEIITNLFASSGHYRFPDERDETPKERALVAAHDEQIRSARIDAVGTDRSRIWAVKGLGATFHCWMEEGNDVIIRLEHGRCFVEAIVPNAYEQKRRGARR